MKIFRLNSNILIDKGELSFQGKKLEFRLKELLVIQKLLNVFFRWEKLDKLKMSSAKSNCLKSIVSEVKNLHCEMQMNPAELLPWPFSLTYCFFFVDDLKLPKGTSKQVKKSKIIRHKTYNLVYEKSKLPVIGKNTEIIYPQELQLFSESQIVNYELVDVVPFHFLRHVEILNLIKSSTVKNILDLGAGDGKIAELLVKNIDGVTVRSIDKNSNSSMVEKKDFFDSSFNISSEGVILSEVIEHLFLYEVEVLLAKIKKTNVVKDIFITTPVFDNRGRSNFDHKFELDEKEFKELFKGRFILQDYYIIENKFNKRKTHIAWLKT